MGTGNNRDMLGKRYVNRKFKNLFKKCSTAPHLITWYSSLMNDNRNQFNLGKDK